MVPWACGIARNMVHKFLERHRNRGLILSDTLITAVSETQHRMAADADGRLEKLPDCLKKLTAEQRALLRRCYTQGDSIKDVAKSSHLDPNTLYKRLERIRRTLFECIEPERTKE